MNIYAIVKRGSKSRIGKGFSQGELKEVGVSFTWALNRGIPIDTRRSSQHSENIATLKTHLHKDARARTLALTAVKGIGQKSSEQLKAAGFDTIKALVESDPEQIAEKLGVSAKKASKWIENANNLLSEQA